MGVEFSAHDQPRPTFVIDMKFLVPLVFFLVLAYNTNFCLGHHPLPTTETKTTKMTENLIFKETENDQRLNNMKNLWWYASFSENHNNAFDLFFRRFYL